MKINSSGSFDPSILKSQNSQKQSSVDDYMKNQMFDASLGRNESRQSESQKSYLETKSRLNDQVATGSISDVDFDEAKKDALSKFEEDLRTEYSSNQYTANQINQSTGTTGKVFDLFA